MERVVILTGGNLGDVAVTLRRAEKLLSIRLGKLVVRSSVMESEAWGFEASDKFLNQVLVFETDFAAETVLDICQEVEHQLGRRRDPKAKGYKSRPIDVDILFYGNHVIDTPRLSVPHPLIAEREFVLRPLNEIMPNYIHPVSGDTIAEILSRL